MTYSPYLCNVCNKNITNSIYRYMDKSYCSIKCRHFMKLYSYVFVVSKKCNVM